MRIVCQQTILMKYRVLFVSLEKSSKIWNCRLLQIIGHAEPGYIRFVYSVNLADQSTL